MRGILVRLVDPVIGDRVAVPLVEPWVVGEVSVTPGEAPGLVIVASDEPHCLRVGLIVGDVVAVMSGEPPLPISPRPA